MRCPPPRVARGRPSGGELASGRRERERNDPPLIWLARPPSGSTNPGPARGATNPARGGVGVVRPLADGRVLARRAGARALDLDRGLAAAPGAGRRALRCRLIAARLVEEGGKRGRGRMSDYNTASHSLGEIPGAGRGGGKGVFSAPDGLGPGRRLLRARRSGGTLKIGGRLLSAVTSTSMEGALIRRSMA